MGAVMFASIFVTLMIKFLPLASTGGLAAVNSSLSVASLRPECTVVNQTNLVSCLPSFIIAGTQKSGTTVLAALLSNHPMVRFSRRKETHFFDKKSSQGVASYLKLFPPWNSTSRAINEVPLFGEATPSYIASRNTCKRIAAVVPNAKLIILVREPVNRAHSEYQMKRRRVAQQEDFIAIVTSSKKQFIRCMAKYPSDYEAIAKCVPAKASQHSRWPKLVTAWKKSAKNLQSWTQIIEGCFPHYQSALSRSVFGKKRRNVLNIKQNNSRTGLSSQVHYNTTLRATFDPTSCWRHYKQGLETIKPLQEAMVDEINDFQACRMANSTDVLGVNSSIHVRLEHLNNVVDRCLRVRGGISSQYFYRSMYAVQLHHCFQHIPRERFLVLPSGRLRTDTAAVYAEVLSFLGLDGTLQQQVALRNETEVDMAGNTLSSATHTTVANDSSVSMQQMEPEQLARAAVDKHFPNFARSTGWSLHSEYAPLPLPIQQFMQAFFVEQNELLFELLQQNFTNTW